MSSVGTLNLGPPATVRPQADIRVLIVAAVRLYREGMSASLDKREGLLVVGTACNRIEALDLVAKRSPHVVVVDMATGESLDLVRALQATAPELKTVAFGVEGDESEIIGFARAGVAGYVPSDGTMDALTSTIAGVMKGDVVCPPLVAATLLRHVGATSDGTRATRSALNLTSREFEVLALIEAGLSNKEIAVRLHIEVATVKNHVHHLLEKLNVTSRAEAVAKFGPRRASR